MDRKQLIDTVRLYFILKGSLSLIGIILYTSGDFYILTSTTIGSYLSFLFGDLTLFGISPFLPLALVVLNVITYYTLKQELGIGRLLAILALTFDLFAFPVGTIISLALIIYFLSPYPTLTPLGKDTRAYRMTGALLLVFAVITTAIITGVASDVADTILPKGVISPQAKIQTLQYDLEGRVDVIIELQPAIGPQAVQMQSVLIQSIQALGGVVTDTTFTISNAMLTTIDATNLEKIASDPRVSTIYPNIPVWYAPQSTNTKYTMLLDNSFSLINVEPLWEQGLTGEGVVVAVVDTGINSQLPIFQRNGETIVIDGYSVTGYEYVLWHGTAVASCIASQDETRKGIAPEVELLNVNVFLPDGAANLWDIKKGWDWVARWKINHPDKKVICCNSIGAHPYAVGEGGWISPSPLSKDANVMVLNYDIPMIVAAGNRATISTYLQVPLKVNSPGQAQYVLTVGAVDDNLNLGSFSCRGGTEDLKPKPDCVAPGVNIKMYSSDGSQYTASGTSFSTPLTAGVVALLAEEHKEHSATQLQDAIKDGARDLGIPGYDTDYGYGMVDAQISLAAINGEKPEKTYTTIGVADIDIPLGTLPIIGIIGLVVLFYPEIRKRR